MITQDKQIVVGLATTMWYAEEIPPRLRNYAVPLALPLPRRRWSDLTSTVPPSSSFIHECITIIYSILSDQSINVSGSGSGDVVALVVEVAVAVVREILIERALTDNRLPFFPSRYDTMLMGHAAFDREGSALSSGPSPSVRPSAAVV